MPKFLSTRISVVSRGGSKGGGSAVDASGYIDREKRYSEYDGHTYYPDAKEDLVHKEVDIPDNAPREYLDPSVLWNEVEKVEKAKNAQLCRMMKASLPNEWTYELAVEVVRKYVMENFVSKGMCCDWAIHDSVNKHGQRNLHFHCLMTMRSMDENGKWLPKQRKIYILDEHGNKIRQGKNYKCKTEHVTDWDDRGKAKEWRKNLSDLINQTNEAIGVGEKWEHRSFKELGLDILPTIHLGSEANALENKGIHTERGDYNRKVMELRGVAKYINVMSATINSIKDTAKRQAATVKNEITELIDKVVKRHGRMQLPIISGKYLRKVSHREKLQDPDAMKGFAEKKGITTFDELQSYIDEHGAVYDKLSADHDKDMARVDVLKEKISAWERYKGFLEVYNKSQSLKGFARLKFDKENRATLDAMPKEYERFRKVIPKGEKITPDAWRKEIDKIIDGQDPILEKMVGEVYDLAYAEVIGYNRDNEQREHMNEVKQKEREQERSHKPQRKHSYQER